MKTKVDRLTVDLSAFPDLVVIYLGMRANSFRGLKTILSFGPRISQAVAAAPDGLLLHENLLFSLLPPHVGMRQYWRDFIRLLTDDLPVLPMYFRLATTIFREGVTGVMGQTVPQTRGTWNVADWDILR